MRRLPILAALGGLLASTDGKGEAPKAPRFFISHVGHQPFPAPKAERFVRRVVHSGRQPLRLKPEIRPIVVNTQPQPWEKHAARLAKRPRMAWDARVKARKMRQLEQEQVQRIADHWA